MTTAPEPTTTTTGPAGPAVPPPPLLHAPTPNMAGVRAGQPPLATNGTRFVAYLLDVVLMAVTLYIGWLIWAAITAGDGQTPGKKIMKVAIWDQATGAPASWAKMVFLRGVLFHGIVAPFVYLFTLGIMLAMPLWDRNRQTIVDKMSSTVCVQTT